MPQKSSVKPENSAAFKHSINSNLLERMAEALVVAYDKFDSKTFVKVAKKLDSLELKQRVALVSAALHEHLPKDFSRASKILLKSLKSNNLRGFDLWPYTHYIQTYGLEHFEESMNALRELTKVFTSEFAVRPFLRLYPNETLKLLSQWASDENMHVRRWVSEGTRSRLPWGEKLTHFIEDPSLTLPLLEQLKNDPELYVRKSVANHLNDIAKDNPGVALATLKKWLDNVDQTSHARIHWIRNHALRTLIKKGHEPALDLMGVSRNVKIEVKNLRLNKKLYRMNESIEFSFKVVSRAKVEQKLIVDYIIHHVRSNKSRTPKVFKLKNVTLAPGESLQIKKWHSLRAVTTRKYYSGTHLLEVQINGKVWARSEWVLAGAESAS
jgi:3-methyladenine DNA glycosylase AlkC